MNVSAKWVAIILLATGVAMVGTTSYAHEEGGESGGHASGHSGGKGKGPKYMGGDRGSSHTSSAHKGGSSHHDGSSGGSKSAESKIFHGKSGGSKDGHEDEGTAHSH